MNRFFRSMSARLDKFQTSPLTGRWRSGSRTIPAALIGVFTGLADLPTKVMIRSLSSTLKHRSNCQRSWQNAAMVVALNGHGRFAVAPASADCAGGSTLTWTSTPPQLPSPAAISRSAPIRPIRPNSSSPRSYIGQK